MLVLWQFVSIYSGTGKQTERFINKGSEGTLCGNASSYFVNCFNDENVIY